jgi:hypothetical protein
MTHPREEGNEMWNPDEQSELGIVEQKPEVVENPFSKWKGNEPLEDHDGLLPGEKKPEVDKRDNNIH